MKKQKTDNKAVEAKYNNLFKELKHAAKIYYADKPSVMTDSEYDNKLDELRQYAMSLKAEKDNEKNAYPKEWNVLFDSGNFTGANVNVESSDSNKNISKNDLKIHHNIPMLSLLKVYDMDGLEKYFQKTLKAGAEGFNVQLKFDGQSLSAVYKNGTLTELSTRGNGIDGRNISYLINNNRVTVKGLPDKLNLSLNNDNANQTVEVRGELMLTFNDFSRINESKNEDEKFTAIRNAGVGIVCKAEEGLNYDATLTFVSYRLLVDGTPVDYNLYRDGLENNGFIPAETITGTEWGNALESMTKYVKSTSNVNLDKFENSIAVKTTAGKHVPANALNDIMDWAENIVYQYDYVRNLINIPTDGIVFKPVNEEEMNVKLQYTGHHPISQIAYKIRSTEHEVTVRNIEWSVGKNGITPVLIYDPIDLDGVRNDRATFHNASFVRKYDIREGSKVLIQRAGGVIPAFVKLLTSPADGKRFAIPSQCPECGSKVEYYENNKQYGDMSGDNQNVAPVAIGGRNDIMFSRSKNEPPKIIVCPNVKCPGRIRTVINMAVKSNALNIKGLGEKIIQSLVRQHMLTNIADIYALNYEQLSELQVDGRKVGSAAKEIMNQINKARTVKLQNLITALSIPNVGVQTAKLIMKTGKYNTLEDFTKAKVEDLENINSIGHITAVSIAKWFKSNKKLIQSLTSPELGLTIINSDSENNNSTQNGSNNSLLNQTVSITGDVKPFFNNRNEFIEFVEQNGGTFAASPNSKTTIVVGDKHSSSSKMKKALTLNLNIMTVEEFFEKFGKKQ